MKQYLEYLTPAERKKAAEQGQTNLSKAKLSKAKPKVQFTIPEWANNINKGYIADCKELYKELKINTISHPARGVYIFDSNTLYSDTSYKSIHDDIIMALVLTGKMYIGADTFEMWHRFAIDKFVCLATYNPKTVVLSESYTYAVEKSFREDVKHNKVDELKKFFKERGMLFLPVANRWDNEARIRKLLQDELDKL